MTRDLVNEVTTITIQTSQLIHFQLRHLETTSGQQFDRIFRN